MSNSSITLISRWKLRNGCGPELLTGLRAAVAAVQDTEPGTLAYTVHLGRPDPLDVAGDLIHPEPATAHGNQSEVIFIECYADAAAFATHLQGSAFRSFKDTFLKHFYTDPVNPDMPLAETTFLTNEAYFVRPGNEQENTP